MILVAHFSGLARASVRCQEHPGHRRAKNACVADGWRKGELADAGEEAPRAREDEFATLLRTEHTPDDLNESVMNHEQSQRLRYCCCRRSHKTRRSGVS